MISKSKINLVTGDALQVKNDIFSWVGRRPMLELSAFEHPDKFSFYQHSDPKQISLGSQDESKNTSRVSGQVPIGSLQSGLAIP